MTKDEKDALAAQDSRDKAAKANTIGGSMKLGKAAFGAAKVGLDAIEKPKHTYTIFRI
jgi:hypothetical protein